MSDGRPREKRKKKRSKTTTCPFLKQVTLENFRDLALVRTVPRNIQVCAQCNVPVFAQCIQ